MKDGAQSGYCVRCEKHRPLDQFRYLNYKQRKDYYCIPCRRVENRKNAELTNAARKTAENRIHSQTDFETCWMRAKLAERVKRSGLSAEKYFTGLRVKAGAVHFSYLLNGKRGLSFVKAVRLATAAGIDLSVLQRQVRKLKVKEVL